MRLNHKRSICKDTDSTVGNILKCCYFSQSLLFLRYFFYIIYELSEAISSYPCSHLCQFNKCLVVFFSKILEGFLVCCHLSLVMFSTVEMVMSEG